MESLRNILICLALVSQAIPVSGYTAPCGPSAMQASAFPDTHTDMSVDDHHHDGMAMLDSDDASGSDHAKAHCDGCGDCGAHCAAGATSVLSGSDTDSVASWAGAQSGETRIDRFVPDPQPALPFRPPIQRG